MQDGNHYLHWNYNLNGYLVNVRQMIYSHVERQLVFS